MSTFVHSFSSRHVLCVDHTQFETVLDLKRFLTQETKLPLESFFLLCNGGIVADKEPVKQNVVYHTYLRLPGGKGGFGSMLRAIGAQIEKTTNHEACRDLSGRRMRDMNNEKDLKEWLAKQANREKEREERRQERLVRRRAMPNHKFDDPVYDKQRSLLSENQEDALQTGLQKFLSKPGTSSDDQQGTKRKLQEQASGSSSTKKKAAAEWLGLDIDNLSDLSSGDEEGSCSSDSQNAPFTMETPASSSSEEGGEKRHLDKSENSTQEKDNEQKEMKMEIEDTGVIVKSESGKSEDGNTCQVLQTSEEKTETQSDAMKTDKVETDEGEVKVEPISLDEATCAKDLETLGLDGLKQELMDRGLKCGGTLEQRAQRLFSVKGLTKDQIDPSLFSKTNNGKKIKNRT